MPDYSLQYFFSFINFGRTDIYSGKEICHDDIKFEQASVLHNLGALHAELGGKDERMSDEVRYPDIVYNQGLPILCLIF